MKRSRLTVLAMAFAAGLMLLGGTAFAGGLERDQVASGAKWLIHVDFEELRTNSNMQYMMEQIRKDERALEKLAAVEEDWGVDMLEGFKSLTMYSTNFTPEQGVAIVHVPVDRKALEAKAVLAPMHESVMYGEYEIHTWLSKGHRGEEKFMAGAIQADDRVVFAHDVATLEDALDVLDGRKAGLGGAALAADVPARTILYAEAAGLDQAPQIDAKSPLARYATHAKMVVTQDDDFVYGDMAVRVSKDGAGAIEQARAMMENLRTMALTYIDSNPDIDPKAGEFIAGIKVTTEDLKLGMQMKLSNQDVFQKLQEMVRRYGQGDLEL